MNIIKNISSKCIHCKIDFASFACCYLTDYHDVLPQISLPVEYKIWSQYYETSYYYTSERKK